MPLTEADVVITGGPQYGVLAESPGGPPAWEDSRTFPPPSPPPPPAPVDVMREFDLAIRHSEHSSKVELSFETRDPEWTGREVNEARQAEVERRVDAVFAPVCTAFIECPDAAQHRTLAKRAGEARQAATAAAAALRTAERQFNADPSPQTQAVLTAARTGVELARELVVQTDRSLQAVLATWKELHDQRLAEAQSGEVARLLARTAEHRQRIVQLLKAELSAYDADFECLRRIGRPEVRREFINRSVAALCGTPAENGSV